MAEERIPVQLILNDGSFANANFILYGDSKTFRLTPEFDNRVFTKTAHDFFYSLREIRRELDSEGILLNCYGASKNVRPSGMSSSMCGGVRAYKLTLGKKSGLKDIVEIWKTGTDVQPVTVAEQDAFFNEWQKSVGIDKNKKAIPTKGKIQQLSVRLQKWFLYVLIGLLILLAVLVIVKH